MSVTIDIAVDAFVFNPEVCKGPDTHIAPAGINFRLIDIGTGKIRENCGVYVHWVLPTIYRTGEESAEGHLQKRRNAGKQRSEEDADFKPIPNRWLVVRRIKANSMVADAPVPEVEGWTVESDRLRDVSELHNGLDTQTDLSFVKETTRVNLAIMSSSLPGKVFSICDNFSYKNNDGETKYLEACDASYLVFGWHSSERHGLHLPANATLLDLFDGDPEVTATTLRESEIWTLLQGAVHDVKWSVQHKPAIIPADEAAALFKDPQKVPIAVGAGPLDALFTYIQSQSHDELKGVEELILKIQTLIQKTLGLPCEPAAAEWFYEYQEPTLLIAAFVSPWPKDHANETKAHLSADFERGQSALTALSGVEQWR